MITPRALIQAEQVETESSDFRSPNQTVQDKILDEDLNFLQQSCKTVALQSNWLQDQCN